MTSLFASTDYPADFPCPERDSYSFVLDSGLLRDPEAYAVPQQRREYDHLPTIISVNFVIPVSQLFRWQDWMNKNAFVWFNMELAHPFMAAGTLKERTPVRCTDSVMQINYLDFATVQIALQLEISPTVFAESNY